MSSPAQVNSLKSHTGFWLRLVSNHVSARFRDAVEARGVSVSEWVALRTLYAEQNTTHNELINALGMTKGAASKIVTRLELKGLAKRLRAEGKLREQELRLTRKGKALVPILVALADENDAYFFEGLSKQDHESLLKVLKRLVALHGLNAVPVD